jgi:hypothetical protein
VQTSEESDQALRKDGGKGFRSVSRKRRLAGCLEETNEDIGKELRSYAIEANPKEYFE